MRPLELAKLLVPAQFTSFNQVRKTLTADFIVVVAVVCCYCYRPTLSSSAKLTDFNELAFLLQYLKRKRKEAITPLPEHYSSRVDYTLHKLFITDELKTVITKLREKNQEQNAGLLAQRDEAIPKTKRARISAVKKLLNLAHPGDVESQLALLTSVSADATNFDAAKIISEEQLLKEARSAEKRPIVLYNDGEDPGLQQERFRRLKWE
jgi:hypothetical protein